MPYYKKKKSQYGKRPVGRPRKVYRKRRPITTVSRPGSSPFSNTRIFKLRYCQPFVLNPGASGVISQQFFSANDLHDPDSSGSGHQPMGYDQLLLLYNHYVVLGSKLSVCMNDPSESGGSSNVVGIYLSDTTTVTTTDYDQIIEQKRVPYKVLASDPSIIVRMYKNYSAKKWFNVKDVKDNLNRIGATFGSSPVDEAHYCIWAAAMDKVTDTASFNCVAVIDYIVSVSEPKELAQS